MASQKEQEDAVLLNLILKNILPKAAEMTTMAGLNAQMHSALAFPAMR